MDIIKSIEISIYNKVFATLSTPTDITTDSAGNVYVLDSEMIKYKVYN